MPLNLTEQLKFDRFKAVDTFNVGLFSMLLDRPTEALALFRQARAAANLQSDVVFAKELLYNQAVAAAKIGEGKEALESFSGNWKITDKKNATHLVLHIQGDLTLPLPGLMKKMIAPVVEGEFEKLVEQYIDNLTKQFGGEV